jgi:hypothetical protein
MNKKSIMLLCLLTSGLFIFSFCPQEPKVLLYNEDGNYVVDNNYIIKSTAKISEQDLNDLMVLDTSMARLTKGQLLITKFNRLSKLVKITDLNRLTKLTILDKIGQINEFGQIRYIDIGCLDKANIDWAQLGDFKNKFDAIVSKYNPQYLNGSISIRGDQIVTAAVKLQEQEISSFINQSKFGADAVDICGDYMGVKAFSRIFWRTDRTPLDLKKQLEINRVLVKYKELAVAK